MFFFFVVSFCVCVFITNSSIYISPVQNTKYMKMFLLLTLPHQGRSMLSRSISSLKRLCFDLFFEFSSVRWIWASNKSCFACRQIETFVMVFVCLLFFLWFILSCSGCCVAFSDCFFLLFDNWSPILCCFRHFPY